MSIWKWLAISLLLLVVGIPSLALVVISTDTGSRTLIRLVQQQLNSPTAKPVFSFERFEGRLARRFEFSHIRIHTAAIDVNIDQVVVDWRPEVWLFNSLFQVNQVTLSGVRLTTKPTASNGASAAQLPELITPWPLNLERFQINQMVVNQTPLFDQLTTSFEWYAANLRIHQLRLQRAESSLSTHGQITFAGAYPFKLELNANAATSLTQLKQPALLQATLAGDLDAAQANGSVTSDSEQVNWQVTTSELLGDYKLLVQLESEELDLNSLLNSNQQLPSVNALTLNVALNPAQISTSASFDAIYDESLGDFDAVIEIKNWRDHATAEVTSNLTWNNVIWPTAIGEVRSTKGQLSLIGGTPKYDLQLDHELEIPAAISEQWRIPKALQHHLKGSSNAFTQWTINTQVAALNAAQPLTLNADADLNLGDSLTVSVAKFELQTALLGQALTASGAGSYEQPQQAIEIESLSVDWNDLLELSTAGRLAADNAKDSTLNINLSIADVSAWNPLIEQFSDVQLLSTLAGDLKAQARLQGTLSRLSSDLNISSGQLSVDGWTLEDLQFNSTQQLTDDEIRASIKTLNLNVEQLGRWELAPTKAAALQLKRTPKISLQAIAICLQELPVAKAQTSGNGSICINTEPNKTSTRKLIASAENLSWDLPLLFMPDRAFNLTGQWDLHTTITQTENGDWNSAEANLTSERFAIKFSDDQRPLQISQLKVAARYAQDDVDLTAEIIPANLKGQLSTKVSITNVSDTRALSGQLQVNFPDLRLLQLAAPKLLFDEGNIAIDMAVSGTLTAPKLAGTANIVAQQISFLETGSVFTNNKITVTTEGSSANKLLLRSESQSTRGELTTSGQLDIASRTAEIAIRGSDFRVVDKPTLQLDISPSVNVLYSPQQITIRGDVSIPYARIEQPDIENTVSSSADVEVYENNELIRESIVDRLPIDADITFRLGKDVRVNAYGFDGRLEGNLAVTDDGKRPTSASGSINVASGAYEIYGQELVVQRGALVFTGGVITNPGLDLRVLRSFSGSGLNSDVEVGAQVGGTITEPRLSLFSTPSMSDSEILSYLVLGRAPGSGIGNRENLELQAALMLGSQGLNFIGEDLKNAFSIDEIGLDSGDDPNSASFFIGKYLNPRLYVKYGIGIIEPINTFFLRYQFSDAFLFESTSTTQAQGGDFIYVTEDP